MSEKPTLISAIILSKNEQDMIANCIETVQWCDEVIVVDSQSTDSTAAIAQRSGAHVYLASSDSFAERRNFGLTKAKGEWVFYLDADERVTPQLAQEIQAVMTEQDVSALSIKRNNIHYGKWFEHGGWQHDWVTRVFKTEYLKKWSGKIHESPEFEGTVVELKETLVHLTHRTMVDGLIKSIDWTGYEAELLFDAGAPAVTVRTLLRKTFMEFFRRAILKKGRKDGIEGWIESLVQAMNRFIVYERLWELQRKPSLEKSYQKIDEAITKQWQHRTEVKKVEMSE